MVRDADTSRLPQTPDGTFHPATLAFLRAQRRRKRRVSGTFGKWTDAGGVLGDDEASGFALSFGTSAPDALVRWPDNTAKEFSGDPNDLLTYTSPSTKYVMNSSGVLVPGTTLRTDHDASGNALGLLIEEQRTNLFLNSDAAANQTITISATGDYTLTVWGSGSVAVAANTATGTGFGTATDGSPVTFNISGTGTIDCTVTGSPDFVNVEKGSFGTSPILTAGSQVTRNADNISLATTEFPFDDGGAGTVIYEAETSAPNVSVRTVFELFNDGNNRIGSRASNVQHLYYLTAGSLVAAIDAGTKTTETLHKTGLVWDTNDFAAVIDGGTVATDSAGALNSGITTLNFQPSGTDVYLNGHIKSFVYLPRRMSNADLQARTA